MSNQQNIAEPHKLDATVFIYRHKQARKIEAHYIGIAKILEDDDEWEHISTVDPRAWIEYHYEVVEQLDTLLVALENAVSAFWKLDDADVHAQEAESAIARVKGGAA